MLVLGYTLYKHGHAPLKVGLPKINKTVKVPLAKQQELLKKSGLVSELSPSGSSESILRDLLLAF